MASSKLSLLVFLQLLLVLSAFERATAQGLKLGFYQNSCPTAETVIKKTTSQYISRFPTLAAAFLRMHFHDCFVRGCDGSVLLNSTRNNQAEKSAIPNLSLTGFNIIDAAKSEVEKICPGVVSCSDILTLVARDAVSMAITLTNNISQSDHFKAYLINGPHWDVPTGRRDGNVSVAIEALINLPPPFANITTLKTMFAAKGLNAKDLVVLSGGHTIGRVACAAFNNRLYNFTGRGDADPSLDPNYAANLRKKCGPTEFSTTVEMDPGSYKTFDEDYYTLVAKRRGLFQSDSALLNDPNTKAYVKLQATTDGSTFAKDFAQSMVKMGNIGVLTGKAGQIRKHCAFVN